MCLFFFQLSQIAVCNSVDSCIQTLPSRGDDLRLVLIISTVPHTRSATGSVLRISPLGTRRVDYTTKQSFLILKWWWRYPSPESGPVSLDPGTCAEPLREKGKASSFALGLLTGRVTFLYIFPRLRKPGSEASTAKGTVERN